MESYNPQKIEPKWQRYWEKEDSNKAKDFSKKPKKYILIEFPYPSGDGLHVGHVRSYAALDAVCRKKRMEGFNVLFPIGFDAFGLPAENYALKTGVHPQTAIDKNIATFKRQLKSLGLSFDWSREINTADPKYYKWTQWIFLKLFEKGLAYQAEIPINWCPSCKIGLANEEVIAGSCERCGAKTEEKRLKQWMIKITKYADRLIEDLGEVDYPERVKAQQINWIGKSYGTEVDFKIDNSDKKITVFTTRVDTLFSGTYLILAPENPLVKTITTKEQKESVERYIREAAKKNELERVDTEKERTGAFTGTYAINPATNEKIPIWIADFVLAHYGTGAVFADAHDQRDFEMAKKYNIPLKISLRPKNEELWEKVKNLEVCYSDEGILVNSGQFDGLTSQEAIKKITQWLENKETGRPAIQYKLRDWVFSRQHYWGEPIPIIHCEKCGVVPVPEKDLPLKLPYIEKYQPTSTGESPLANISSWVNVKCPKCKSRAKRETDTMPNWAGSNWYFMRYCDPKNNKALADVKKLKYWMPVDWYNGGMEHTTLHLLYSRFIYKFLFDIKVAPESEPYKRRTSHGIVLADDGRKMSKSFGNVINPDGIIKKYGADTLRIYEMFIGPFDQQVAWSIQGVNGAARFLNKVWQVCFECSKNKKSSPQILRAVHSLNKKIDGDLEIMKFNTIISSFMQFINLAQENKKDVGRETIEKTLILLSLLAPHFAEEVWEKLGHKKSIFFENWPKYDQNIIKKEEVTLIIQINGRVRDKIEVNSDISEREAKALTLSREKVKKYILQKEIKKVVFVPGKLINIVVEEH
ncbi:MAG: leucine--tRNA ligase [Candidatus Nealsonbacteria bacterium]|nr:leucine--tRNA ligase [Candidatus Nealsonbacteria bacterium]